LVALAAVFAAAASAVALLIVWLPRPASEQADRIDFVFWFVTAICIGIFALVAAVILYAVFKFRAQPGEDADGPPVHGNTGLEIVWTAVPAVLVTAISIVSAVVLAKNEHIPHASAASSDRLTPLVVDVTAQQFAWSFGYPGKDLAYSEGEFHVPVDRQVQFKMHAQDVIHSFWVPEWRIKKDNVPGITTTATVTPTKIGTYQLICTELCGFGHASMRAKVVVESPAKFREWVAGLDQKLPPALKESVVQDTEANPVPLDAGGA
jgi:cytochrome c oxidase subunit 2